MVEMQIHFDGLMQKRRNSSALAMELRLFCIKPSIFVFPKVSSSRQDKLKHVFIMLFLCIVHMMTSSNGNISA